jgi:hypothetical protein
MSKGDFENRINPTTKTQHKSHISLQRSITLVFWQSMCGKTKNKIKIQAEFWAELWWVVEEFFRASGCEKRAQNLFIRSENSA